MEKILDQRSN
uniref:Uncharacterized protein n=1 Tax=Anguilla anguilla TaxID=7936 RepID=A0A0E9Q0H6_ANGAN